MRRRLVITFVALGIVVFIAISVMLARAFNAESAERAAVTDVVRAEARGDAHGAVSQITKCGQEPSCRAAVADVVARIHRSGAVQVLQLEPSTGFSLGSTHGTARIAYRVGGSLPIVQCVHVRRAGNVVSGLTIQLIAVGPPLKGDAVCGPSGP